jgi:hypothetical protein
MKKNKKHSVKTRRKIQQTCLARSLSETWKFNVTRAIIRRCAKSVQDIETGEIYESISSAARAIGCAPIQISRVCHGDRTSIYGMRFSFVESNTQKKVKEN